MLIDLPDRLWRRARRDLATSRRPFIDLQSALAIDLLLHVPIRMENLAALNFEQHLHWPQGRGMPALLVFKDGETKNEIPLEFEIPTALADRLQVYRNEIAPAVTGKRPDAVFVTWAGKPRTQAAHHACDRESRAEASRGEADAAPVPAPGRQDHPRRQHPGAYELVRQLLGPQEFEDDHQLLCRHRHPPCRTRARRARHEAARI